MPTLVAATESVSGTDLQHAGGDHALEGQREGDEGAGDGGGARAAVGLNNVAIEPDGALAKLLQVGDGAQRAADQAGNFERAAGLAFRARPRAACAARWRAAACRIRR